jgi:hypothetical protein
MAKPQQLLFLVEAKETSKSDWHYLRKFMESPLFKRPDANTLKNVIYLDGKNNYRKKEADIHSYCLRFRGPTHVIFVFDMDHGGSHEKKQNQEIVTYCQTLDTHPLIIWFNKDIETVFLGHSVRKAEKTALALAFHNQGKLAIDEINLYNYSRENPSKNGESNILLVLKNYLPMEEAYQSLLRRKTAKDKKPDHS